MNELPVGLSVVTTKTVSESDVYLFAGITGDFHPNHVDEEYCKQTPLGRRVAHGALVVGYMSMASTRIVQGVPGPVVSVGYDRIRHIRPVYIGDTITVRYEIVAADPERARVKGAVTVTNQEGELVAIATHILKLL